MSTGIYMYMCIHTYRSMECKFIGYGLESKFIIRSYIHIHTVQIVMFVYYAHVYTAPASLCVIVSGVKGDRLQWCISVWV